MALQSELEPGLGPSWDPEGPVNAGVRQGSIVRKLSMQEVMERGIDDQESKTYPASVQEVLEQSIEAAPSQLGTGSEELDRYAGSVFGIERAIANGEVDPYDAIKEEIDRVANSDNAAEDIYNRTNARAAELVVAGMEAASAASSSDEQLLAAVEHLKQFKKTTEAPWGFEVYANTVLNGLVALEGVEGQRIREERIFQDYTLSLAGNKYQETSKVGVVWDFTKLLVLPGTTFAMGDFVKNFNGEFFGTVRNALGEIVGRIPEGTITGRGFKAYQNAVKKWWELPARDRLVGFPALNEHINDIAGSNVFVYMAMIQPFIEKESITDLNFDYHVDTATLLSAGVGTPVAKALKFAVKVRNYRKPISILIRSGETERAGALIARALKDRTDEARRITGMTKDELAWSAYPLDVSEVGVVGQIRGAAAEAAKSLEDESFKAQDQVNKVFREITDPSVTPLRNYFDEAAMAAKRRQVLGDLNDYPNMARVVDMDDAGFTVEVTSGSKYAGVYDADTLRRANAVLKQNLEDATESLETIRQNIRAQHELDAYTKTPRIAKMLEERDRAAQALMHIRRRMDSDQALLDSEEGSVLLDKIQNLDARIARAQARADRSVEIAADEAFAANSDAERLRKQLAGYKEQIKRNEKIIKDLEKPPKVRTERVQYTFKEDGTMDVETLHDLTIPSYASPSQEIGRAHV